MYVPFSVQISNEKVLILSQLCDFESLFCTLRYPSRSSEVVMDFRLGGQNLLFCKILGGQDPDFCPFYYFGYGFLARHSE